jgi:FkbM family methyltransferase
MQPVLVNGRWELLLPDHRAARPEWRIENGGWERERLDHMFSTTRPGDRVLYVGAEESDMCALLQTWGASVFLVEPNELVIPNAKAIWDANDLDSPAGFYVGFCGLEDSPHWAHGLHVDDWPECANGPVIGDHGFKELHDPGDRPIVSIDTLVSESGWVPQTISMDIEGAEWPALRGAERTLREHRPRLYLSLHPEFVWRLYEVYAAEVRQWIKDLGYRETLLAYSHECHLVYEPA